MGLGKAFRGNSEMLFEASYEVRQILISTFEAYLCNVHFTLENECGRISQAHEAYIVAQLDIHGF